jgi:hypothetical protein
VRMRRFLLCLLPGMMAFHLSGRPLSAVENQAGKAFVFRFDSQALPQRSASHSCSDPVWELGFKNVLCDQKVIWGTLLHPKRHWRFIIPFAAATATLIATDKYVARAIADNPPGTTYDVTKRASDLGLVEVTYGSMGAFYAAGWITRNKRLRETGLLVATAYVDEEIVKQILKYATRRERPATPDGQLLDEGRGRFWFGGISFPAGHAMNAWTLSSVLAFRYRDKPIIKYGAYGVAVAVSVSRIGSRAHFNSDVLVGSVLGYLIGKYVVRAHSIP